MSASRTLRVLIADSDGPTICCLRAQLTNLGHSVIAETDSSREVGTLARQLHPDLIVMDVGVLDIDEPEACRQIDQSHLCPIVLLGTAGDAGLAEKAKALSAQACLVKPVSERDLGPVISLALDHFQQIQRLRRDAAQLRNILETRSMLKRATALLASRRRCSPGEAQTWIQQEARAKKAGLEEVAAAIMAGSTVGYRYDVPI